MLTFDSIPQARVVRKGAQEFTPPPQPKEPSPILGHLRTVYSTAVGLWPLTAVVLLMLGLLWMASMAAI